MLASFPLPRSFRVCSFRPLLGFFPLHSSFALCICFGILVWSLKLPSRPRSRFLSARSPLRFFSTAGFLRLLPLLLLFLFPTLLCLVFSSSFHAYGICGISASVLLACDGSPSSFFVAAPWGSSSVFPHSLCVLSCFPPGICSVGSGGF